MTAYHKPTPAAAMSPPPSLYVPAVAVFYGRGGLDHVDAIVLNYLAAEALAGLCGAPANATGAEVELLHDPATGDIGIKPWAIGRPATTLHMVHPTRFRGRGPTDEWGAAMRDAWPAKVEAPQFLAFAGLPEIPAFRPAAADVRADMLVFNSERLVIR